MQISKLFRKLSIDDAKIPAKPVHSIITFRHLFDLPDELIVNILEFVRNKRDQRHLCLTSKRMRDFMRPIMYSRISLGRNEDDFELPIQRLKLLSLYDTLSADQVLAATVKWLRLPDQGGALFKKDVRKYSKRAVEIGIRNKADVSKKWRRQVMRQYHKRFGGLSVVYFANGQQPVLKDAVFHFFALAASLLLTILPSLERLELHRSIYTGVALFESLPQQWTNYLPMVLPRLRRIDVPLRQNDGPVKMLRTIGENVDDITLGQYSLEELPVVRSSG